MTEPALRFLSLGIALSKEDEALLEKIHAALDRLTRRRKSHIAASSTFLEEVLREAGMGSARASELVAQAAINVASLSTIQITEDIKTSSNIWMIRT